MVSAAAALLYFDHRLVHSLSGRLIEKNTQAAGDQLLHIFEAATRGLRIAQQQISAFEIAEREEQTPLFATLSPLLEEFKFLDSINLADASGNEFVLIKKPDEILTRRVEASAPTVAHWRRYVEGEVVEEWTRQINVSPLDRPWYRGALKREPGSHFWTDTYSSLTTKEPGVSVSSRSPSAPGGAEYVVACNITLTEISRYTTHLLPSEHGMMVIFTDEGKTIGLPPDERFEDKQNFCPQCCRR